MLHILKTFGIVLVIIVGSLMVAVITGVIYLVALFFGWPMLVCAGIATVLVLSIILIVAWKIGDRG